MAFLPATPRPASGASSAEPASEPPAIPTKLYSHESPLVLSLRPTLPRASQTDERILRAEERFQRGKRYYQEGELDASRREFDSAIDVLLGTPENLDDRHKIERKLDELTTQIYRYDVEALGAGMSDRPSFDRSPLEDILEMTFPVDPKTKLKVKELLAATVSQLPLQLNDAVLGYINYFSGERGRRSLVYGLKRSGRYRDMIRRILAEEGVPQELIYLAQAESGFLPRAMSHAAAGGMWQFVSARGRQYGLMQTPHTDERFDPEKATRAAARHLKDLFTEFGDWYLAIAAYNCGPGTVEKAVQRTGYADFWELRARNTLPRETTNYVPIILAMTIMAKNAKAYDLEGIEPDRPLETDVLPVRAATNLRLVADVTDSSVSELRDLNPSLLSDLAPAGHELRVPKGSSQQALSALERVPESRRASWRLHRVSAGDTLASIARQYNASVAGIASENPSAQSLEAGEYLLIPAVVREAPRTVARAKARRGSAATTRYAKAGASSRSKSAKYQTASARSSSRGSSKVNAHRRAASGRVKIASMQAGSR